MNGAFHIAGVGLTAQQNALDTIANNIANMNTRAFKRSDVRFSEIMATSVSPLSLIETSQIENTNLAGVAIHSKLMLDNQGTLEQTNNALDFAIDGEGFVELISANERNPILWRGGTLQITSEGFLAAENGMMLAARINVPDETTDIQISKDGRVISISDLGDNTEIGQISIIKAVTSEGLKRLDGGLYSVTENADIRDFVAGEEGAGILVQGAIERSNVDLNQEMVQMMIVQRAYAANAQLVQAADEMLSIANNLRR